MHLGTQFEHFLAPAAWVHTTLGQLRLKMVLRLQFAWPGLRSKLEAVVVLQLGVPRRVHRGAAAKG